MRLEVHGHRKGHVVGMRRLRDIVLDMVRDVGLGRMLVGRFTRVWRRMGEDGAKSRIWSGTHVHFATCAGYKKARGS